MAIITYSGHTARAKDWFEKEDVYFGIGGTTPWSKGDDIPDPETEDEEIEDLICYKKVESKKYVIPDPDGDIYYHKENYREIDPLDIFATHCRWVLVSTYLNYDEAPVGVGFRKIGVYTGVKPAAGYESSYVLLPTQVADPGSLEVVANDTVTVRSESKREKLQVLCEF